MAQRGPASFFYMSENAALSRSAEGMRVIKVPVPLSTYHQLQQQAQRLGIPVSSHVSPVLVAVGNGELRARHEYAPAPAARPASAAVSIRERLSAIPRLSDAERAVLVLIAEDFEAADQQCVVETNRELGYRLRLSRSTVSNSLRSLEKAGWLQVRLHARGGNGRQIWATAKLWVVYRVSKIY